MTDLSKLRVSLTKHGAYKVYRLIEHFPIADVLKNTWDKYDDIKIDNVQARKNLSALRDGDLPALWESAKSRPLNTLKRLVFLAIVFSHHDMIAAFRAGGTGSGRGRIEGNRLLKGKAFTTTKNNLEELGLAAASSPKYVEYDLRQILADPDLPDLAAQLLHLKLIEAQWDSNGPLVDECIRRGFHEALSISSTAFRQWLAGASELVSEDDEIPEATDADEARSPPFVFTSGHTKRRVGNAKKSAAKEVSARLIHNAIQNTLVEILTAELGAANVGTELGAGSLGTSVDLVAKRGKDFDFYEIKTSSSVKKCLRQAIAQLLEYAYWPDESRAKDLIVVAEAKVTSDAKRYLKHLREKLRVPIYYRSIDVVKKTLTEKF